MTINVSLTDIDFVGDDLQRCECVMTTRSGDLFMPDKRGGVSILRADGRVEHVYAKSKPDQFLPNGIALLPDRSWLIADLGLGGVYHLQKDGTLEPFLTEVDGRRLEPTNFVGIDREGRTWITVSTRLVPREQAMRKGHADGYIVMVPPGGGKPRVVAEGIGFTNEAIVDPSGQWLYVNETIARRTSRYPILADGSLGARETFAQYGPASFPDGFAFDETGAVWTVTVVSNRVIRTLPGGAPEILLEDADPAKLDEVERAFQEDRYTRAHLDSGGQRRLGNLSGIAFGGADLKTVYLGSLFGTRLGRFRAPVAGAMPVHWDF